MEIKLTITGLDPLAEALVMIGSAIAFDKSKSCCKSIPTGTTVEPEEKEVKKEVAAEIEKNTKEVAKISRDDLRREFHMRNSTENRAALKDILSKYNAKNISSISESDFQSVLEDLRALQ